MNANPLQEQAWVREVCDLVVREIVSGKIRYDSLGILQGKPPATLAKKIRRVVVRVAKALIGRTMYDTLQIGRKAGRREKEKDNHILLDRIYELESEVDFWKERAAAWVRAKDRKIKQLEAQLAAIEGRPEL